MLAVYYWIGYEAAFKRLIHNSLRPIRACPEIYRSSILVVPYPTLSYPLPHLTFAMHPFPLSSGRQQDFVVSVCYIDLERALGCSSFW